MEKIDFVVTWVDGSDPEWLAERAKYLPDHDPSAGAVNRYRDWGLMKYWFRGVEKFAPWVNKVYFVTWGHYPEWLNLEHPKLKIINHKDYIPAEYLPTFNSNVIELNLHRIPELSEYFVLFNDDTLLVDTVKETDFFKEGAACETIYLGQTFATSTDEVFPYMIFNNIAIINKYFEKHTVIKKYWSKFYSLKFGPEVVRSILLTPFSHFSGFLDTHLPASHFKSTFNEVWDCEHDLLEKCSGNRFRTKCDVTNWLMKNWRTCQGRFAPRSRKWGKSFSIGDDPEMVGAIRNQKYKAVCLNDDNPELNYEENKTKLIEAFDTILPQKSSFEV